MRHQKSHGGSKQKNNDNIAVIAACSVAAFAFIVLFLFCCLRSRRNKVHPKNGLRDDRPLLNFCSSDVSRGSSVNYNFGNSSKKDHTSSSDVNSISIKAGSAVAEGKVSEAIEKLPPPPGANHEKLPPPPGANHEKLPPPPGANNAKLPPPPGANNAKLPPPPGANHAKLPLPPGRVPPPAPGPAPPDPPAPGPATPASGPSPPPPPPPSNRRPRAPPPPPLKGGRAPPNPPKLGGGPKPPPGKGRPSANKGTASESDSQKAKLKPFFWDKVLANPEQSMVWNEIKAGSFQFNEEMMEDLFGYNKVEKDKNDNKSKREQKAFEATQYIQIIDPKKAHNLSILLKASNVTTEEVCDAIKEGNELPTELIETLLKMAPTSQEELKLRLYSEDMSKLGPADRFIKVLVDIPFAYKRLESLLFMCSLQNETSSVKESFSVLEVACTELRKSRLFLKLLEAVLKTGNRMNDGTFRGGAQAFKLDTLLKLSDVKGTDGKTTLLHFVVQEIIRSEGLRAARRLRESSSMNSVKTEDLLADSSSVQESPEYYRSLGLEVVSNLSNELSNVKKAAIIDGDMLTSTATKLGYSLKQCKEFLKNEMSSLEGECEFRDTLEGFIEQAEGDVIYMLEEEKRITSLVKSTADYFHGTPGKDEGMRLFMIVRDFLVMVDKVCVEVKKSMVNPVKAPKKEAPSASTSRESQQQPAPKVQERLFPAIKEQRKHDSSSDDES